MIFIIDTGPLTHFAQAGELPLLEKLIGDFTRRIPEAVHHELSRGLADYPSNHDVFACEWLSTFPVSEHTQIWASSLQFKRELGGPGLRNAGEAECLAVALYLEGAVYLDDGDGTDVGDRHGIECVSTLELLAAGVASGKVSRQEVSAAIDALLGTGYRLPVSSGHQFLAIYFGD